ncbi:MAG TPA: hypothetical protein VMR76_01120, partial [Candidatus Saccharimonadia bacterium]|nr:hypothetical protein [Candidatus Saccharimonadia bacterium]
MVIIIISDNPKLSGRPFFIAETMVRKGHEAHYLIWDSPYRINRKAFVKHLFTSLKTKEYKLSSVTVHKIGRLPYYWPYVNGLLFKYQVKKLYKKVGADLIYAATYTNETEVPKKLPFIYDLADDYSAPGDLYGSLIYKLAFKLLDVKGTMKRQCQNSLAVTAISDILVNYAKQYNNVVIKLPSAIEKETVKKILQNPSIYSSNDYSFIYISIFGQWSRPIETMQAVLELRKEFPEIDLILIGPGVEVENIKMFIKNNDAEEFIHYLGPIYNRTTVFTYIKQSSIGLSASIKDKFRDAANSVKVLEYSVMGKKVVSTNLAEVESLHFPNIFTFSDTKKGSGLKNTMREALLYKTTNNEFKDISDYVLREYNWDKLTDDLLDLIKKVNKQ